MNIGLKSITTILGETDSSFLIPVYQRKYDWKKENCKQLFKDLVKTVRQDRPSHFMGSMVISEADGSSSNARKYLIIDGQQRLTTIYLILIAIYNALGKKLVGPSAMGINKFGMDNLAYKIDNILFNCTNNNQVPKLIPLEEDSEALHKLLFKEPSEYISDSNITINYRYFLECITSKEITVDELFCALQRLSIVNIALDKDDKPQLIFESLNSTGLALQEGDKIRNYILMPLPADEQDKYYQKYWHKIELLVDDVSVFIRDYLTIKQHSIPKIDRVYLEFKEYMEDKNKSATEVLEDLLRYAEWYHKLIEGDMGNFKIKNCLYRLNRLGITVIMPFFLEVLRIHSENKISLDDVGEIFLITERYLFRRTIRGLPSNSLNKLFMALHNEILQYDNETDNYLEKFKYTLLSKKENARFPDDKEFIQYFSECNVYEMSSQYRKYILERFENVNENEQHDDVYAHLDADGSDQSKYTIEHIMPQALKPEWKQALGTNHEEIHKTWLHRIANLTLTAYNSEYSNNSFAEKKNMENGLKKSGINMNHWIASKDKWTEDELKERNEHLMKQALEIWKLPTTTFQPAKKPMDTVTLDDNTDLTKREIAKFSYNGKEQDVSSWAAMFESIVTTLHTNDPLVLASLADKTSGRLSTYVQKTQDGLRKALQIDNGIFIESNTSTGTKIYILKELFKLYNADSTDLVFFLNDNDSNSN